MGEETTVGERRIHLTLQYDGAAYVGGQRQSEGLSVQGAVESAIAEIVGHEVGLFGAGRTDSGVHAMAMPAHFNTSSEIPIERLAQAINSKLSTDISVIEAAEAKPDFDARRDAILRWYRYQLLFARSRRPLGPRAWRVIQDVDLEKMESVLPFFEGEHDFAGFRSSQCVAKRTRLTMERARLTRLEGLEGIYTIDLKCRSFLQRMVRFIVGAAIDVGLGKTSPEEIADVLRTGNRPDTLRAAPPEALCLMGVAYTPDEAENILTQCPTHPSF